MKTKTKGIIALGIVITLLTIVGIKLYQGIDKTEKFLKEKGYSESDIAVILQNLDKEKINIFLNTDKNEYLVPILTSKYYIPNNLFEYLEYAKKNNKNDIETIIGIINVGADNEWYDYDTIKEIEVLNNSMLVNKFHSLPTNYEPNDIVPISVMYAYNGHKIKKEVNNQYVKMWYAAKNEGLVLIVNSSYRTFDNQQSVYDSSSDQYASRPGYSEHQTGLALDIITYNSNGNTFENTEEYTWLVNNAYKYGFILRYPKGKEYLTGYSYESWHYRYLGVELATKVHSSGLTYDEYYAYYCEYKGEC